MVQIWHERSVAPFSECISCLLMLQASLNEALELIPSWGLCVVGFFSGTIPTLQRVNLSLVSLTLFVFNVACNLPGFAALIRAVPKLAAVAASAVFFLLPQICRLNWLFRVLGESQECGNGGEVRQGLEGYLIPSVWLHLTEMKAVTKH